MDEYLLSHKERLPVEGGPWGRRWDVFISAHNSSERVRRIAGHVRAARRYWLKLPEYKYDLADMPNDGEVFALDDADDEVAYLAALVDELRAKYGEALPRKRIVIDISGFIGHYVIVMIALLRAAGVARCDVLYGEPVRYIRSERTKFSDEAVLDVRQIAGFEGIHNTATASDLLVLAVGYDNRLVAEVSANKEHARKVQLFGLPSLRPDMYQENLLRAAEVAEAVGPDASHPAHFEYAPAHDPFVTASVLSDIVRRYRAKYPSANVYLSPLSTKPHALGFALYYLRECAGTPTSMVYPFCGRYERETSEGLSGVWLYRLELGALLPALEGGV